MVAEPKYLAKIALALSAPAGENAYVDFEVVEGEEGVAGFDFDPISGTVSFAVGDTGGLITVVTRNPYVGPVRDFVVKLSTPVNCQLGETQKTVVLPGLTLRTLLQDSFTAADGISLIGHQPEIGSAWSYYSEGFNDAPVVILGNTVHFEKKAQTTPYDEWVYPHSGGALVKPDFVTSWGMLYNDWRAKLWAVTRFDYYTETPYDPVESERWVFQEVDPTTGEVTGYIEKPNYAVFPRDPVNFPSPVCDEMVSSGNLLQTQSDQAIWLASTALGDSNTTFPRHLWKWDASTLQFRLATKPITEGRLLLKYARTTDELWAITSIAANVGAAAQLVNNVVKIDQLTGLVDRSLALTFNGLSPATTARVAPAQLAWSSGGRMFCITEPNGQLGNALASDDIARTLFEVDPVTGATTPLANLNGQGRFFGDMFYDTGRNAIVLFAVDDAAYSGSEYMYRYTLADSTLTLIATLPAPDTGTTYITTGGDKSRLPAFTLDQYQNLIWYYPRAIDGLNNIVALDAETGALAHEIRPTSLLDPGHLTYTNQTGANIYVRAYEAVYFNLYALDNGDNAAQYDSRGAIVRVKVISPSTTGTDVISTYASPAIPGGGTYSVKASVESLIDGTTGSRILNWYCYGDDNVSDFGGFSLDFSSGNVTLFTSNSGDQMLPFDFSKLPVPFNVELRWDMDSVRRSLYLNDVVVHSIDDEPVTAPLEKGELYVDGITAVNIDNLLVTQGGPAAGELPINYFQGSILSPASTGNIVIDGPGAKFGVTMTTSVSGNAYDNTGNAQIQLDLSQFSLDEVRVECRYRPQVGQRSYGPSAGGDNTSATTRNQYGSIRAVFGGDGANPEVSQQAPLNAILDTIYAVDAPLPLAPFDLVYEINGNTLRYAVNGGAWVSAPLDETSPHKLNQLYLTAWVSAIRFEADGTFYEGPYALSELVVKDIPPVPPALAWYGRSSFGSWSAWNTIEASGTQDGSYPGSSLAARILDDTLTGPVVWTNYWYPAGGHSGRPTVTFPKGPAPDDFGSGNVDWAKGVDVDGSVLAGEGFGEMALTALVDGVRIPGYLWVTWAAGPQSYATTAWGYSPGDPPPQMLRTLDNFNGFANNPLTGRVPEISASETAWNTLSEAPNSAFKLDGNGRLVVNTGTEGSAIAWGGLDLPGSTSCKLEFVIRSVAGGPLLSVNTHIWRAELSLGSNNAKAYMDDGFVYAQSSNTGTEGAELTTMPGAAGATVAIEVLWANKMITVKINGVLTVSCSTDGGEPYPGNPDGAGTFYFELAAGNMIDYIDITQTPMPTGVLLHDSFIGTGALSSHLAETGASWLVHPDAVSDDLGPKLVGGKLISDGHSGSQGIVIPSVAVPATRTYYVQFDVMFPAGAASDSIMTLYRAATNDLAGINAATWLGEVDHGPTANKVTILGNTATSPEQTLPDGTPFTVRFEFVGWQLVVKINGVEVLTDSDAIYQSLPGGFVGFKLGDTNANWTQIDNYEVGFLPL